MLGVCAQIRLHGDPCAPCAAALCAFFRLVRAGFGEELGAHQSLLHDPHVQIGNRREELECVYIWIVFQLFGSVRKEEKKEKEEEKEEAPWSL